MVKKFGKLRKKKSNLEKLIAGNPGRRKLTVIDNPDNEEIEPVDIPPFKDYQKESPWDGYEFKAEEIYKKTFMWLVKVRCQNIVPSHLIEHFAISQARYIQCEYAILKFGLITKHLTTGVPIQSPYVNMANIFTKQITVVWTQIYQIVKKNSAVDYRGPNPQDDMKDAVNVREGLEEIKLSKETHLIFTNNIGQQCISM